MDKRWLQLGHMLVDKAVEVKRGERVMISMSEIESFDLARSVYEAVIQAGGYPQIQFLSEKLKHSLLKYGNDDQISWVPELEAWGMDWADVYIGLRGAYNFGELTDIPTDKAVKQQTAMGIISSKRWEKTRWTLIRIPTEAFAVQAKVDFDTILDMFFNSCFVDFENEREKWTKFSQRLEKGKRIRIVAHKTDLSFSVEGMKWVPALGGSNMPDGEIATAPRTETIDGTIYFENPGVLGGRLIPDISLRWNKGQFVSATSSSNQEFLTSIVNTPGANTIGEFALGINREMNRFCNDILFDEKIYGTIHIALGRAYPMCNGTNQSSIHWDIVKDFRLPGSKLYLDDVLILENGEFIL